MYLHILAEVGPQAFHDCSPLFRSKHPVPTCTCGTNMQTWNQVCSKRGAGKKETLILTGREGSGGDPPPGAGHWPLPRGPHCCRATTLPQAMRVCHVPATFAGACKHSLAPTKGISMAFRAGSVCGCPGMFASTGEHCLWVPVSTYQMQLALQVGEPGD